MKRTIVSLLLAFCLTLGLSAGALAAEELSGQSYAVSGGVIRLFAPDGYEGTETSPCPATTAATRATPSPGRWRTAPAP